MTIAVKHITAEQFFESGSDHCELIEGEIVYMSPGGFEHADIAMLVGSAMRVFVDQRKLGAVLSEMGFIIARKPDTVLVPDAAFVRNTRAPKGRHPGYLPGAPTLAIEVKSPTDRITAVRAKAARFISAGTEAVWLFYPDRRTVEIYRPNKAVELLTDGDILKDEKLLPGFSLKVADIFR